MYPEVDVTIEHGYLGEGITGIKGVLTSMTMNNETEAADMDSIMGEYEVVATTVSMRVTLEMVLTSVKLGPEKVAEVTKEIVKSLERAIDF